MAPKVTLHYFDVPGRAEPIRWILAYGAGEDWTDHRMERAEWPAFKSTTPFGQVPCVEIDGKPLGQSYAIMRYLARQYGLTGKDAWEDAQIDAVADYITGKNNCNLELKLRLIMKIFSNYFDTKFIRFNSF